ncbi:cobalt-precorrin-6A reductase [Rhizobium sp. RAF56]|uniref:cobalt-precorrin-6A reductase n=1 Tax=Rhizobium sp. RAF56 TaxID=3233062 RepID=UPI003F9C0E97
MGKTRILILGGTTEARLLGAALAARPDLDATISLAGRTVDPLPQPVPVRIGGFGGAEGLARYLREKEISILIDATHPFAAQMSRNAVEAAAASGLPAFTLRRAPWQPVEGDRWVPVSDVPEVVSALGPAPRHVFLAIGRQEAHHVNRAPMHHYLVRSVDPVEPALTVPHVTYIRDLGPFRLDDEIRLMRHHQIDALVTKNSGGSATYAKIEAARQLGVEVIMVERAPGAGLPVTTTVEGALNHLDHLLSPAMKRGV